jgi:hypothetical protein
MNKRNAFLLALVFRLLPYVVLVLLGRALAIVLQAYGVLP